MLAVVFQTRRVEIIAVVAQADRKDVSKSVAANFVMSFVFGFANVGVASVFISMLPFSAIP